MRPLSALIADDGTVFLPVAPTAVVICCGCDKAHNACVEHEKKRND